MPLEPSGGRLPPAGLDDHVYYPLDGTKHSFRLLSIGVKSNNIISCQLYVIDNFEECPAYIAVSYTWGPETPTKAILLNGAEVKIRANLHGLFQQLVRDQKGQGTKYICSHEPPIRARNYEARQKSRQLMQSPSSWQYFWIDALCIDQASTEEKSHQVAMMGDIYRSARFVLAWLGPEADDSVIAMRALDDLQIYNHTLSDIGKEEPRNTLRAVNSLFRRPYWTRMWVVQEFVCAREVFIRCGDAGFTVGYMSYHSEFALEYIFGQQELRNFLSFQKLMSNRQVYKVKEQPTLTDIMLDFAERECSDVRDKVFALLSLASLREYPAPDYSATKEQVFFGVIEKELEWLSFTSCYGDGSFEQWETGCVRLGGVLGIDAATAKRFAKQVYEAGYDLVDSGNV